MSSLLASGVVDVIIDQVAVPGMPVLVLAGLQSGSFVPEGYAYIGHSSQADALARVVSKHESKLPASLPVRSTGYTAFVDLETSKQGQQQRSSDQQHETLLFTHEGHLYTKPYVCMPAFLCLVAA